MESPQAAPFEEIPSPILRGVLDAFSDQRSTVALAEHVVKQNIERADAFAIPHRGRHASKAAHQRSSRVRVAHGEVEALVVGEQQGEGPQVSIRQRPLRLDLVEDALDLRPADVRRVSPNSDGTVVVGRVAVVVRRARGAAPAFLEPAFVVGFCLRIDAAAPLDGLEERLSGPGFGVFRRRRP